MKQRFLFIVVVLVMILGVCGCGSSSDSALVDPASAEEEADADIAVYETQNDSYRESEVNEVEDTYTVDELVMMIESGELSLDDVCMQVANGEIYESEDILYEVENIIAEFAGKSPVENVDFEVGGGYQYYLYDYDSNVPVPVLGMNFPYGWYNSGRTCIMFDGIEYMCRYQFHADVDLVNRLDYGYFTNLKGGLTYLNISTDAESYFGRDYHQVELQINDEYTTDTPYGQWMVQQVILWQDSPDIFEPDETKTVDGTDWYGYYTEVSMVNNGGHEICIWLKYSDKDSTYLKDIFTDIL